MWYIKKCENMIKYFLERQMDNEYSKLNKLAAGEKNPKAYAWWQHYRKKLTEFAHENFQGEEAEKSSLAIWGVGESNDIDLKYLSRYYKLMLFDRDTQGVKNAVRKYELSPEEYIYQNLPFWDIDNEDYLMLEAALYESMPVECILEIFENIITLNSCSNISDFKNKIDYSLCVGLHSQLNSRIAALIYEYKDNYEREDLELIMSALSGMNSIAVERLNDIIYHATSRKIIWGYEILALSGLTGGDLYDKAKLPASNIAGARELEADIGLHNGCDMEVLRDECMIWSFLGETKSYLMRMVVAEKKK
jgi:hypothetical protein